MLPRHSFRAEDHREQCSLMHGLIRWIISHPAPLLHSPAPSTFAHFFISVCGRLWRWCAVRTCDDIFLLHVAHANTLLLCMFFSVFQVAWGLSMNGFLEIGFKFDFHQIFLLKKDWLTPQVSNIVTKMHSSRWKRITSALQSLQVL